MRTETNTFAHWKLLLCAGGSVRTSGLYTASAHIEDQRDGAGLPPENYHFEDLGDFDTEDKAICRAYDYVVGWIDYNGKAR